MKANSLHGDLAIDLLSGHVERSLPQVQPGSYGRATDHIDHSLNSALNTTNTSGEQQPQASRLHPPKCCEKAVRIRQQNTSEKTCTNLATEHHFIGFSKDVFRRRPPSIFRGCQADVLTFPEQENGAQNGNFVHGHFFKIPSRQDVQFFYRPRSVGKCTAGEFWGCKQLLLTQLSLHNTNTEFDCSVQG